MGKYLLCACLRLKALSVAPQHWSGAWAVTPVLEGRGSSLVSQPSKMDEARFREAV